MLQCPEEEHVDLYEEFLSAARYGELESVTTLFPLVKEQMGQLSFPSSSPTTFLSALHMAAGNGHTGKSLPFSLVLPACLPACLHVVYEQDV